MATTYTLISSATPTGVNTITFSSIPNTYTDLIIQFSGRTADTNNAWENLQVRFNSDTSASYSFTFVYGGNSTTFTSRGSASTYTSLSRVLDTAAATTNIFSSGEIYIPNYTSSAAKQVSGFGTQENNSTTVAYVSSNAMYWTGTSAISNVTLYSQTGANFVTGSSFYLYGIKNS